MLVLWGALSKARAAPAALRLHPSYRAVTLRWGHGEGEGSGPSGHQDEAPSRLPHSPLVTSLGGQPGHPYMSPWCTGWLKRILPLAGLGWTCFSSSQAPCTSTYGT